MFQAISGTSLFTVFKFVVWVTPTQRMVLRALWSVLLCHRPIQTDKPIDSVSLFCVHVTVCWLMATLTCSTRLPLPDGGSLAWLFKWIFSGPSSEVGLKSCVHVHHWLTYRVCMFQTPHFHSTRYKGTDCLGVILANQGIFLFLCVFVLTISLFLFIQCAHCT